jgi:hypothetical protein
MAAERLLVMLLSCTLLSGRAFAGDPSQTAGRHKMKAHETAASSLEEKFKKINEGMSERQVLGIMGPPRRKEHNTWEYFLERGPTAGEQLMIYQIVFRDHRVAKKQIAGGPDATGPAPNLH